MNKQARINLILKDGLNKMEAEKNVSRFSCEAIFSCFNMNQSTGAVLIEVSAEYAKD